MDCITTTTVQIKSLNKTFCTEIKLFEKQLCLYFDGILNWCMIDINFLPVHHHYLTPDYWTSISRKHSGSANYSQFCDHLHIISQNIGCNWYIYIWCTAKREITVLYTYFMSWILMLAILQKIVSVWLKYIVLDPRFHSHSKFVRMDFPQHASWIY